jgi:hypothetical protein
MTSFTEADEELGTVDIGKELERVKWFVWHGNVVRALDTIEDIEVELDFLPQNGESRRKLLRAVREFRGYIEAVKKQQMRWSESDAHNLLQVRTKVLDDQLRETFVRWYPGMQTQQENGIEKKAA